MKLEIEYEIKEVTRYVIYRKYHIEDGAGDYTAGFDVGDDCGEFKRKADAEKVRDALEADIARKVRGVL